jgi:hypothetical protein
MPMFADARSFGRYLSRFVARFVADATWGRDQLIGLLIGAAIMAYQIKYGLITAAQTQAAQWALLKPYGWTIGGYFVLHAVLTAWRLDRDAQEKIGLRARVNAWFDETGLLRLEICNEGHTDTFSAQLESVGPTRPYVPPRLPARWREAPNDDTLSIAKGQTGFIDLIRIPNLPQDAPRDGAFEPRLNCVVFTRGSEHTYELDRRHAGVNEVTDWAWVHVIIEAHKSGQRKRFPFQIHLRGHASELDREVNVDLNYLS